jgi:hypothetical protein
MLESINSDTLLTIAMILLGLTIGIALAFSDWKSKFTIIGIITPFLGFVTSITAERIQAVKLFIESSILISPALLCLNIALGTFLLTLIISSCVVFWINFIPRKRKNEPDAFYKAMRRAIVVLGRGLYHYVTVSPELAANTKIQELEKHIDIISLIHNTLFKEVSYNKHTHNRQHFIDSVNALARVILNRSFNDSLDLQKFRLAFFQQQGDRLEYMVTVNNGDWTAHSMQGFKLNDSFVGFALKENRPLKYPKDKRIGTPYVKRKHSRYKSFIVVPVPCSQKNISNIGAITVDYIDKDEVFTELRIDELFAFAQFIYALYLINIKD